jgi:hypothetical protein
MLVHDHDAQHAPTGMGSNDHAVFGSVSARCHDAVAWQLLVALGVCSGTAGCDCALAVIVPTPSNAATAADRHDSIAALLCRTRVWTCTLFNDTGERTI